VLRHILRREKSEERIAIRIHSINLFLRSSRPPSSEIREHGQDFLSRFFNIVR
jgi:hypothetical protein